MAMAVAEGGVLPETVALGLPVRHLLGLLLALEEGQGVGAPESVLLPEKEGLLLCAEELEGQGEGERDCVGLPVPLWQAEAVGVKG